MEPSASTSTQEASSRSREKDRAGAVSLPSLPGCPRHTTRERARAAFSAPASSPEIRGYSEKGNMWVVVHRITGPGSSRARVESRVVFPPLPITDTTPGFRPNI